MNAKAIMYIILTVLFLYMTFRSLISRKQDPKMVQKYAEESLKKYNVLEGIGCVVGLIGCVAFLLGSLGIVNYGFDITGDTKEGWIVRGIWIVLVIVPSIFAWVSLKKKDQAAGGTTGAAGKSSQTTEDEDY